jgi:hypothetical protein
LVKRKVDGLSFKAGPTQSGSATPSPPPVGGEIIDINLVSVLLARYWPLIVLLMVPLAFVLYKKRTAIPKWFLRMMYLIKGF